MKKLIVLLILCFPFLVYSSLAFADDKCAEDPRECFDFEDDDDDVVVPEDPRVKRTFDFPAVKAGFVIDFYNPDILPHVAVELFTFTVADREDFAVDFGVSTSRVFVSATWEFIPIIKAGPSIWGGYNVKENDPAFGIGFSILDF